MATPTTPARPPFPPFTRDSAMQKVRLAEDAWNTRDPGKSRFGICDRFTLEEPIGVYQRTKRNHCFLSRKWTKELDYRLIKEMWAFTGTGSPYASLTSGATTRITGIAPTAMRTGSSVAQAGRIIRVEFAGQRLGSRVSATAPTKSPWLNA